MDQRLRERRALLHDLRSAIEHGELMVLLPAAGAHRRRDHRLRGAGALAASDARPGLAGRVHPARRGERADPADRRMGAARSLPRGGVLAEAAAHRGQISPVQFRHGDLPALVHAVLLETGLAPGRLELEITESVLIDDLPRGVVDPAPAQGARRAHRDGRFRHRLFVAVVPAGVPVRQDQDRPLVHLQPGEQPAVGGDRARRDRRSGAASTCR